MREIDGYVIDDANRHRSNSLLLFGPPVTTGHSYELLTTNGIQPFNSHAAAISVYETEWRVRARVRVCRLHMRIAESREEAVLLKKCHSLIAIQFDANDPNHHVFFGAPVEEEPRLFDCVSHLINPETQTFRSYIDTLYAAQEIARQSQCRTAIASFHLK